MFFVLVSVGFQPLNLCVPWCPLKSDPPMLIPRKCYSGERLSRFDHRRIGGQWPRDMQRESNRNVTAQSISKMKNPPEKGIEKKRELVINY